MSDTTLQYDTTTKALLYAESGVSDYWVLDLKNRQLIVFRNPGPGPDGGTAYRDRKVLTPPIPSLPSPLRMPAFAWPIYCRELIETVYHLFGATSDSGPRHD